MSETQRSDSPKPFQPPYVYVNELIKLTQEMAPNANRWQWNQFGLISRKIELSHEYYLNKAYRSAAVGEHPELQTKTGKMQREIFNLQESLYQLIIDQNQTAVELSETTRTNEELNKEIDILQKQVCSMMADEDDNRLARLQNEKDTADLAEDVQFLRESINELRVGFNARQ